MIEKIKQETLDSLTELLLEEATLQPIGELTQLSRKYVLAMMRSEQQDHPVTDEHTDRLNLAYQELEQMSDEDFEVLRQELASVKTLETQLL